jgi:APA family basic amino acid/polyamine antiporter
MAVLSCGTLMAFLGAVTWIAFGIWLLIGLAVYFGYARHRSLLNKTAEAPSAVTP